MRAQIDALYAAFERLSSREQSLLLLVLVLVLAGVVGFGSYFTSRSISRTERRIDAKLEQLREIAELRADYQARLREQQRLTNEVRANASTRILSHVEKVAREAGVELANAAERPGQPTGSPEVREESARVTVNAVSIDRLDAFLRQLDGGNRLVQVHELRVEPNYENPKRLDATITVGTYKATGGS